MRTTTLLWMLLLAGGLAVAVGGDANPSTLKTLSELAEAAGRSGQTIRMQPGVYPLTDHLPLNSMAGRRARKEFQFLTFSGSSNIFELRGVLIEVDTALRGALRPPIHTSEFVVSGDGNVIRGLTIVNVGNGTSPGGALLEVSGRGNTLRDCTFHVRGSNPYGYGDLFGKGGGSVISHRKHSGVLVTGDGTSVLGCRLFMRSFGHGFFVQKDAADVLFEDCLVEGSMRSTDAMLAETSGPAFDVDFRTVMRNRDGEHRVTPGYMKSLSEDGFRTYGQHENLTFRNCTARNMRGGFELRTKTGVRLENCAAYGCERGFWISSDAVVRDCRGDAQYGPLLFLEGDNARVNVALDPAESANKVHALATLHGTGHRVTITPAGGGERKRPLPILLGYRQPGAGEGMSPISEGAARDVTLINQTTMPIKISPRAVACKIVTCGPVLKNDGQNTVIRR
jgi:hypothetical protein